MTDAVLTKAGRPSVLIVGAGLAGLALARALEQRGIAFDMVERYTKPSDRGAGMYLPGNAARALSALGLFDAVSAVAHRCRRQTILDQNGGLLHDMNVDAFWSGVGPCLSLTRGALSRILRDHIATQVRYGVELLSIASGPRGRTVIFSDGSIRQYELIVGADGLNSMVRARSYSDSGIRLAARVCWRMLVENRIGLASWTVTLGHRRALLGVPVEDGRLYVYADADAPLCNPPGRDGAAELKALFSGFAGPLAPIIEGPAPAAQIHRSGLAEVPVRQWQKRGIALIGDAAHASSPSMAQGAAMAFEDAVVLADCLEAAGSPADAASEYWQQRKGRVAWAQAQAQARDRTRSLPRPARVAMLRLFGDRLYARSYKPLRDPF